MQTQVFINFPTDDLARSQRFYEALGYSINPNFSDENAISVVVSDTIYFMILRREYFAEFLPTKSVGDNRRASQTITALSVDSREAVDEMCRRAEAGGAIRVSEATDYGFMYQRDVEDPDGNDLEFFWMDPAAAEQGPEAYAEGQAAS